MPTTASPLWSAPPAGTARSCCRMRRQPGRTLSSPRRWASRWGWQGHVSAAECEARAQGHHAHTAAPCVAAQVVAFQAMVEILAQNFPGAFAGYTLEVTESHQRTKADTSGTAKAVVGSFAKLGTPLREARLPPPLSAHLVLLSAVGRCQRTRLTSTALLAG